MTFTLPYLLHYLAHQLLGEGYWPLGVQLSVKVVLPGDVKDIKIGVRDFYHYLYFMIIYQIVEFIY